jgi:hypothetical protein
MHDKSIFSRTGCGITSVVLDTTLVVVLVVVLYTYVTSLRCRFVINDGCVSARKDKMDIATTSNETMP